MFQQNPRPWFQLEHLGHVPISWPITIPRRMCTLIGYFLVKTSPLKPIGRGRAPLCKSGMRKEESVLQKKASALFPQRRNVEWGKERSTPCDFRSLSFESQLNAGVLSTDRVDLGSNGFLFVWTWQVFCFTLLSPSVFSSQWTYMPFHIKTE